MSRRSIDQPIIDRVLFELRPELLYRCTPEGRLVGVGDPCDPSNESAPDFYICYRRGTFIYRFRRGLPRPLERELISMLRRLPHPRSKHDERFEGMVLRLAAEAGTRGRMQFGPIFYVPACRRSTLAAVRLDAGGCYRLRGRFRYLDGKLGLVQPCMARLVGNYPVSICRTVRKTSAAFEGGVETMPSHRRKGYGLDVVASWASGVWREGRVPCYSTTWSNQASLSIARRLNMVHFATEAEYCED